MIKKDCHASKQAIALNLVNTDKIAIVSLIYDEKYTKTKIKAFNGVIIQFSSDNKIPTKGNHYICIASICIDSIMKIDKKAILKFICDNVNAR